MHMYISIYLKFITRGFLCRLSSQSIFRLFFVHFDRIKRSIHGNSGLAELVMGTMDHWSWYVQTLVYMSPLRTKILSQIRQCPRFCQEGTRKEIFVFFLFFSSEMRYIILVDGTVIFVQIIDFCHVIPPPLTP